MAAPVAQERAVQMAQAVRQVHQDQVEVVVQVALPEAGVRTVPMDQAGHRERAVARGQMVRQGHRVLLALMGQVELPV